MEKDGWQPGRGGGVGRGGEEVRRLEYIFINQRYE